MNEIVRLLEQLRDTDAASVELKHATENPHDEVFAVNMDAILKRRADLEQRLMTELRVSQTDLVHYHVKRAPDERYPVLAIASAVAAFQELVTAVFDAIRTTPKQRYRPSADNLVLSTMDLASAVPVGSVLVSMSVANERLIAVKSDLDLTFEHVFKILQAREASMLQELVPQVGIASISKAYAWAQTTAHYGLDTNIEISKDEKNKVEVAISKTEALSLQEAIEDKSDQTSVPEQVIGELFGIDVSPDPYQSYFHITTTDGEDVQGRLSATFDASRHWSVHLSYLASITRVTSIKYATGEEKTELWLEALMPLDEIDLGGNSPPAT